MLKKSYRIFIAPDDIENIENSLKIMGISEFSIARHFITNTTYRLRYDISLSKYELLFLRLSCSSGEFKQISNENPCTTKV
jgi:hypothetical protein